MPCFRKPKDDGDPSLHLAELKGKQLKFYSRSEKHQTTWRSISKHGNEAQARMTSKCRSMIKFETGVKLIMATNYTHRFKADKASLDRTKPVFFDSVFSDNPTHSEFKKMKILSIN